MAGTLDRPVVVGVDGSPSALAAVRWAADEAVRRGLGLRLVHVCQTPVGLPGGVVEPYAVIDAYRAQGLRWLDEARALTTAVAHTESLLETESLVPLLVKESSAASLLVVGTRGLGGFTGLLVGSTAVSLASRVDCPLVVVRGADHGAPADGPVVVGVDGSPMSEAAVAFAFAEASLRGAGLVAVHAWIEPLADTLLQGHPEPPGAERARQWARETLAERLAGWQEKYPEVRVSRDVAHDRPSWALLRHAKGARLMVVGSRGRGGFAGLLLGSTSQHLLHHAPCPVAIVRS